MNNGFISSNVQTSRMETISLEAKTVPRQFCGTRHRGSVRASHPAAPGLILVIPNNFSVDFFW